MAIAWTLWYDDGMTFSSDDGGAWESPVARLVCITQDIPSEDVLWNEEHYLHNRETGRWSKHNFIGLVDQISQQMRVFDCHRLGWNMPTKPFKDIVNAATLEMRGK